MHSDLILTSDHSLLITSGQCDVYFPTLSMCSNCKLSENAVHFNMIGEFMSENKLSVVLKVFLLLVSFKLLQFHRTLALLNAREWIYLLTLAVHTLINI